MRRRADLAELLQRSPLAAALRLGERVLVRGLLACSSVAVLAAADVDRNLLRNARGIEHSEGRAPGVTEDHHPGPVEPFAHRVDQLVEIRDELSDGHRRSWD